MVARLWRRLDGGNRVYAALILLAIPIAVFHYVSGRIGNGLMMTLAVTVGIGMLVYELRPSSASESEQEAPVELGPDDYWWPDGADHLDDDAWLDRVSDEPLPGPFQAVLDELQRKHERVRSHDD
jgi:hypothetical protein